MASIFTAEVYAIWQALLYCQFSNRHLLLICTDSLRCLQSLKYNSRDALINTITDLRTSLNASGKKIILAWIPGHIGIIGNEQADEAAREGSEETADR
ncbi:hypothetical protein JTB14_008585 [Gonioctena quinquepunctata]|nr:hypothetical protein JTB14_008585 [Gonioctena quinquepunctata]